MIKFEIEQIDNGYLVKGDLGYYENARGDYVDDFVVYASDIRDAFALIANKCDQYNEGELTRPPEVQQDEFSF